MGSVLDIGSGDGRNAIFLAEQRFDVLALDVSPTGLLHIAEKAALLGVYDHIQTVEADIVDYLPIEIYENVITNFTLHFVGAENIMLVLEKMAACTKSGGINLIDDFTQNGPLAVDHPENFVTPELLKNFYTAKGWEVLYSEVRSVKTLSFESPGKRNVHEAIAFIAKKPKTV